MTKLVELYGLGIGFDLCASSQFVAGVEREIEGVKNPTNFGIWSLTKDGSLRGNGYEFISTPETKDNILKGFDELTKFLKFHSDEEPYSFRTSTHVHVNCLTLDDKEIRNIVLLYALFEEFFFAMVKKERRENIHCVPLTETHLPNFYNRDLKYFVERWHKYTALNLKRLLDIGTIEFRHMHGTGDTQEFARWLGVLESLWQLGQRITIDATTLSNRQTIEDWFMYIFSGVPSIAALRPTLFDVIRNSLIDVKFSTLAPK